MYSFTLKILDAQPLILDSVASKSKLIKEKPEIHFIEFDEHRVNILDKEKIKIGTFLVSKVNLEFEKGTKFHFPQFSFINIRSHKDKCTFIQISKDSTPSSSLKALKEIQKFSNYLGPLAYRPIREQRPSYLSSEHTEGNYRGFINLGIIILVAANFRLMVENFLKYGLLVHVNPVDFWTNPRNFPCLSACFALPIFIIIAFLIEKLSFSILKKLNDIVLFYCYSDFIPKYIEYHCSLNSTLYFCSYGRSLTKFLLF